MAFGTPSYDVCDCCGYEFGYDDEPGTAEPVTFVEYRTLWMKRGCPWFSPDKKPQGWMLESQLRNIGVTD
jgi:hypothetical protein